MKHANDGPIYRHGGARIRAERERAAVSLDGLAALIGAHPTMLASLEAGHLVVGLALLYDVATALTIEVGALLPPAGELGLAPEATAP